MVTPMALDGIVDTVLEDVSRREAVVPFKEIKARSRDAEPARDATGALLRTGCGVIAEIKREVPGKGPIPGVDSLDAIAGLARQFEESGAHLIACQTEPHRFHGSLEDMQVARAAVELPMLCRDVIIDPYQIHEARYFGADMVPLQVELLGQARLESLLDRIESLGMTALAEVRTPEDADRALAAGAKVVGVNAWAIGGQVLDRSTFTDVVPGLPPETLRIALGGVRSPRELLAYAAAGADAVVVGEGILTSEDPAACTRTLAAAGQHPACPSR